MDNNDFLKSLSKSLIDATKNVLEGKAHTVPKTEKEKKLAALAEPKDKITHADVLKGRGVTKEEVESIDEISTDTLRSYRAKARDDAFDADAVDDERRLRKRSFGHNQAGKKIIKRGDTLRKEEVEQIDELSKKTLASYVKKAATSATQKGMEHGVKKTERDEMDRMMNRHMSFSDKDKVHDIMKTTYKDVDAPREKAGRRIQGINRAVSRLAKEDVEQQVEQQIDEAMDAAARYKHHHEHAKALLKSIGDHLKAEHEAAHKYKDYRGNKGPSWGHVGSMEHVANQLSNIHDMLARKGEYAESVEVEDDVALTEEEIQKLEAIAEEMEAETEELDEARGRPKLPRDAHGNIIRGGEKASAAKAADEEPAALGYQLRKAASINKPVHFMNGEKKAVTSAHINAFNDHMDARKTAAEKASFQKQAHKSHADFVKAVSAPVPKASKDTGEIVKYR